MTPDDRRAALTQRYLLALADADLDDAEEVGRLRQEYLAELARPADDSPAEPES